MRLIKNKEVSSHRLGWFSWKKLKVIVFPYLEEIEAELKTVFNNSISEIFKQK